MTLPLILSLVGLALVDSLNTSTLSIVVLIILAARRPVGTGWAYAIGAIAAFFVLAVAVFYGASAAEDAIAGAALWLRRITFTLLAAFLVYLGIRRLKARERKGIRLPKWVNPWTAVLLGMVATVSDLPNAFPLFIAIEQLISQGIAPALAVPVLGGYTLIYALPTLVLLTVGLAFKDRVRARIQRLYDRFNTGVAKRSPKLATLFFTGAAAAIAIVVLVR